ncbi:MAG TPA: alkaline phosphatase family protein, partial [Victivallales bacterium]|nr:alkaline phosphatase family protein [Victivallales bacterium]
MKLLILICAALGYNSFKRNKKSDFWKKISVNSIQTVFPALTCPFQATLRTGEKPENHGIIANGFLNCEIRKSFFWEQSSNLIRTPYIWENFQKRNGKVAQLFMQQSLSDSDIILSPAPIHKHHGGMIQDCYSKPEDLYRKISSLTGKKFSLSSYWGPFTSTKSSSWIASAIEFLLKEEMADLIFAYLPHLDYDLQKHGPESENEKRAFLFLENLIERICNSAKIAGYNILIIGDYQIE